MLLSICLAVYNQIDLVYQNISEIVKYKNNDIEIVVSDDCSDEPIEEMLSGFHDMRIRYYRTSENKSHDGNILNGLRHCRGDFIFLFRSKDIIIPEKILTVMQIIEAYPSAVYFLFSALDENGKERMRLKDSVYKQYGEVQRAHGELLAHPSGQIYKRKCLRLDQYEKYIQAYFPKGNGCIVHQLIRMDLALQGDFVTSSCFAWRYAYTLQSNSASVIKTENKISIYAPVYQYPRYKCELSFVDNELSEKNKTIFIKQLIRYYGWRIIPFFQKINEDEEYNSHYNSMPINFSPYKELKRFRKISWEIIQNLNIINRNKVKCYLLCVICKIGIYDIPKNVVRKIVYSNKILTGIWFKVRGSSVS